MYTPVLLGLPCDLIDNTFQKLCLAYALYRGSLAPEILNDAVSQLLACDREAEEEPAWIGLPETQLAAHGLWQSSSRLRRLLHSGDGWAVLCDFLFFGGGYLRELLARKDDAESSVQLEEVLSALALAANYKFAHAHVRPLTSRCGLAERLRALLTDTAPGLMAPRPVGDAVRVMTCHASKGLRRLQHPQRNWLRLRYPFVTV